MKYLIFALTLVALHITPAFAQIERYEFDKAHTQINFTVNHLGYTTSRGKFMNFDGFFEFNRSEPAKSKVDVIIQTNSVEMGDQKWNEHLKNKDFFNVEEFPTMIFKSTSIEVTGDKTAKIMGNLTILETTKPVTLEVTFNKASKAPFGEKYKAGFSAVTSVKRSDYGMTYGVPMVGDSISIIIEVEGIRQGGDVVNP
jgi:polyisoprenoid-binding protein YceI